MIFFLLLIVFSQLLGTNARATIHVEGGEKALPNQYPWLMRLVDAPTAKIHYCGASLLRIKDDVNQSDMVMIAAHCIVKSECADIFCLGKIPTEEYEDKGTLAIVGGDHQLNKEDPSEKNFKIAKMLYYGKGILSNDDIAVIKLASPVAFNDHILPIDLPKQGEIIKDESICTVAGWGRVEDEAWPEILQHINVTIRSQATCEKYASEYRKRYSRKENICASTTKNSTATCVGDSGSPLVCKTGNKWIAYGVVSGGLENSCNGRRTTPGIYVNVPNYVTWIQQQIQEMSSLSSKNGKPQE